MAATSTIVGAHVPEVRLDQEEVRRLRMNPIVSMIRPTNDVMIRPLSGPIALEKKSAAIKRATRATSTIEAMKGSSRASPPLGASKATWSRSGSAKLTPSSSMTRPLSATDPPKKCLVDDPIERTPRCPLPKSPSLQSLQDTKTRSLSCDPTF